MSNIKEYLAGKLKDFSNSISEDEKIEAMALCEITRPTLDRYLSGDIEKLAKIDTATKLFQFLKEKVNSRIEIIGETNLV